MKRIKRPINKLPTATTRPKPVAGWSDKAETPADTQTLPTRPSPHPFGPEPHAEPVQLGDEPEKFDPGAGTRPVRPPRAQHRNAQEDAETDAQPIKVRLQRFMADSGVASRRFCEGMIEAGKVEVNGRIVRELPIFIDPTADRVVADGHELPRLKPRRGSSGGRGKPDGPARKVYLLVHKPERVLTAIGDPGGRLTLADLVQHPGNVRLFPVGRLDYDARGLVLLTNDGQLANRLTHPRFGVPRVFEAHVKGLYPANLLPDLERGLNIKAQRAAGQAGKRAGTIRLEIAGVKKPDKVEVRRVNKAVREELIQSRGVQPGSKTVLRVTLTGPLHVPMQELFLEAGVMVVRLTQVGLGPLQLLDVRPGQWRELDRHEINSLRRAGKA